MIWNALPDEIHAVKEMETFRNSSGNYRCVRLIVFRNKNVKKVCYKSALSLFLDSYIATGISLFKADFLMLFLDEYQNSVVLELIPLMFIQVWNGVNRTHPQFQRQTFRISNFNNVNTFLLFREAGTKVGLHQLLPPVRVRSTRIDSDQLGTNKKIKMKENWTRINSDHKKKNKISRHHLPFTRHFVFFLTNSWLRK